MSSVPYTANYLTEADEKREIAQISESEQKSILCDMYGHGSTVTDGLSVVNGSVGNNNRRRDENNNNNSGINNNNNIGVGDEDHLLERCYEAIEQLPPDKNAWLLHAWSEAEDVVDMESHPTFFLRCENLDPEKAALRQCEYWKTRFEILGNENALKPLTLTGAMEDIIPYLIQMPNLFRILPDDDQGRTVICGDKTGVLYKDYDDILLIKMGWFVFHKALQRRSAVENGIVFIWINNSANWDFPSMNLIKLACRNNLPLRVCCWHSCVSSLVATCITPIGKYLISRDLRLRLKVYDTINKPRMLKELESFGLRRENLPRSIGGTYDEEPPWIDECKHILSMKQHLYRDAKRQRN